MTFLDQFGKPMRTVRDLIDDLQKYSPDLPVAVWHRDEATAFEEAFLDELQGKSPISPDARVGTYKKFPVVLIVSR